MMQPMTFTIAIKFSCYPLFKYFVFLSEILSAVLNHPLFRNMWFFDCKKDRRQYLTNFSCKWVYFITLDSIFC